MDQRALFAINTAAFLQSDQAEQVERKGLLIGTHQLFLARRTSIVVRARISGKVEIDSSARVDIRSGRVSLVSALLVRILTAQPYPPYILAIAEGSDEAARVVVFPTDDALLRDFESSYDIHLARYAIPPSDTTYLDSGEPLTRLYHFLQTRDPDLFSVRTNRFLRDPHILTQLLSQVTALASKPQISYISHLRIIADNLRDYLAPRIRKLHRGHRNLWEQMIGERATFVDGGVSRIVNLPSATPLGIRVGVYSVVPGESALNERETWRPYTYVLGDVLADYTSFEQKDIVINRKRAQEAARYILEPLSMLRFNEETVHSDFIFMHGPLQNAFETYDEQSPNFVPGVSVPLLEQLNVSSDMVIDAMSDIPMNYRHQRMWNQCIPVYLYTMKRIHELEVPVLGVVERSHGRSFCDGILSSLVDDGTITKGMRRQIRERLFEYEIDDEFLFGCVLEEGEYVLPIRLQKNFRHRAHDKWASVVEQFPHVYASIVKTAANRFPFRIEFNRAFDDDQMETTMALLYHTARLLPNYAFPVGLDIVDKYAKVPDWLSKGVSTTLTASLLAKATQTGDPKIVQQLRQLLARSPRDFFFRPTN